ncbi:MAG: hypothetical protein U0931_35995 [Vulcanimicrobiota bacterium]
MKPSLGHLEAIQHQDPGHLHQDRQDRQDRQARQDPPSAAVMTRIQVPQAREPVEEGRQAVRQAGGQQDLTPNAKPP